MEKKLETFAARVQADTETKYRKFFTNGTPEQRKANIQNSSQVRIIPGKKYIKVDVGSSGKFMVDAETKEIYGIKGYGRVHKGHKYGTLDTIDEYYWGEYHPIKLER